MILLKQHKKTIKIPILDLIYFCGKIISQMYRKDKKKVSKTLAKMIKMLYDIDKLGRDLFGKANSPWR